MNKPLSRSDVGAAFVASLMLLPLFFQLHGRVYRSPGSPMIDSGGSLMNVPFPISIVACIGGIVILARYGEAILSMGTVTVLLASMILASAFAGELETRKLVLVAQFTLPALGLVLGQMIGARDQALKAIAAGFVVILLTIVPIQILVSVSNGLSELPHDLWLFSIYQNRQYVPVIFVSAYLIWLFTFWGPSKIHVFLAALMGYFAAASFSALALFEVLSGFTVLFFATKRDRSAALAGC